VPDVRTLVADLRAAFDDARSAAGATERTYRIASRDVCIRSVGPIGDIVDRALAPLRAAPTGRPALVVHCWDTETSGVALPPPPWSNDDYLPGGRIRGFTEPDIPVVFDLPTGTLNVLDARAGDAFCWTSESTRLPPWFHRSPLRVVFGWWVQSFGGAVVHAGAVGDDEGVVLVTGRGGAGKSTTVLSARRAGLQLLSDDLAIVEPGAPPNPSTMVHAAYGTAKVEVEALARLPELADEAVETADGLVLELGARLLRTSPLRAVLAVAVHDSPTELVPVTAAACLLALAPSSILGATAADPATLAAMAALVHGVPCYELRVGPDPDDVAATVREVVRGTA
jgi:hypothetical protein